MLVRGRNVGLMTRSRLATYMVIRVLAGLTFVFAVAVLPPGIPAALDIVLAGVVAVATCVGVNAGGPGERAGARAQDRWFDAHTPPQGDWPPYEPGSAAEPKAPAPEATSRPGAAS